MIWDVIARAFASLKAQPLPQLAPLRVNELGWLEGDSVTLVKSHSSWYYPRLSTPHGSPLAIVVHCSDTPGGTAMTMARKRTAPRTPQDRAASWHISVEADGSIVQQASLEVGCWHALGAIPGVGPVNRTSVGIELIGRTPGPWPLAQQDGARRVWRAVVQSYGIPRARAMLPHSEIDRGRRSDPGALWMREHATAVLDYAYARTQPAG